MSELSPLHLQRLYSSLLVPERRLSAGTASPLATRASRSRGVRKVWCMSVDKLTGRIGSHHRAPRQQPWDLRVSRSAPRSAPGMGEKDGPRSEDPGGEHGSGANSPSWGSESPRRGSVHGRLCRGPVIPSAESGAGPHGGPGKTSDQVPRMGQPMVRLALRVPLRVAGTDPRHWMATSSPLGGSDERSICRNPGKRLRSYGRAGPEAEGFRKSRHRP